MGGRGASSAGSRYASYLTSRNRGGKSFAIDTSKLKDQTLQGVENRIRKLKHEEAFIFDENDKLIAGASGGNSSVGIPNTWFNVDGATVTHGHPTGNYDFGGALSMADANIMASTNWKEMRAAANGKGEYNYIMRRTPKSDNKGLRRKIAVDSQKLSDDIKNTYVDSYIKARKSGKTEKSATHEAAQKATGVMQAYWRKTLPKYGFEYVTPKKEYKYGR